MPSVARINVTPLKGTALQHPERVSLTEAGIADSRRFHLIDASGTPQEVRDRLEVAFAQAFA